ncbi:carcinoembryonic antigen-related cell adhesion molecule 6-like [Onychostoma macrolepis]|uniref:B-cell receptor CD22 n=1 Tax=Onychostoma macrolepis TaxID=369639 RepID=A0A7J6C6H9_9TELE|nr:carcinoembryonic antigen-related cell adhesion molecule 6-like [Onychostoma macrolepis]KAF4102907.1 hypothetical protein G5714_015790 [Onychostoma macrolepis]
MLKIILLLLPGVVSAEWNVNYPPPICAARGSDATIGCNFTYPQGQQVQKLLWCSMTSNHDKCYNKPYVYDSEANNNQSNFQYIGDKTSDCSLLISNINQTHSGDYKFRFITSEHSWTGNPGVNILVHDLRVSMSRSRENGSTIVGDSLNLTCTLKCGDLAEAQWFKNGDLIQQSDPVLTFSRVTAQDSGNYSCSLRNFKTTVSEEFTIYIEDVAGSPAVLIIVVSFFSLVFIAAAVMLISRKKVSKSMEEREEAQDSLYSTLQKTADAVYSTITN